VSDELARHAGRLAHHEAWLATLDHEAAADAEEAASTVAEHLASGAPPELVAAHAALVARLVAERVHRSNVAAVARLRRSA
jgi:hypothetical protein